MDDVLRRNTVDPITPEVLRNALESITAPMDQPDRPGDDAISLQSGGIEISISDLYDGFSFEEEEL